MQCSKGALGAEPKKKNKKTSRIKKNELQQLNVKSFMGASIICRTLEFSLQNGDERGGKGEKKKKKKKIKHMMSRQPLLSQSMFVN